MHFLKILALAIALYSISAGVISFVMVNILAFFIFIDEPKNVIEAYTQSISEVLAILPKGITVTALVFIQLIFMGEFFKI